MTLSREHIRASFSRAVDTYESAAALQREVEDRLLERLEMTFLEPELILDLGCGLGRSSAIMADRYPDAQVLRMDLALPMLQAGAAGAAVCADAMQLPLADASVDLIFSNLMLQWIEDLPAALGEFRRVLKPRGLLLFTTFGTRTLHELRQAWASVDEAPHVNDFTSLQEVGDALMSAGFDDPVTDIDLITVTYPEPLALMRELKAIGAHNVDQARPRGLTPPSHLRRVSRAYPVQEDGRVPATYEVVYGHALGPPPGRPRRDAHGEAAFFPADAIPVRKR